MTKILAIDYGTVRTGIAVTDAGGRMAFPHSVVRKSTRAAFFAGICALVAKEAPQAVVVGLPLHADGSESLSGRQARKFAQSLKRRTGLPVYLMNEFLSTCEAEEQLRAAGRTPRPGDLDRQAAVRILESFLNEAETRRQPV
jgi:putative Holliday junction resolvase